MKDIKLIPGLRFSGFEGDWQMVELNAIADIYDGTHQTPQYVKKGVPFVSVENINNIEGTSKFITVEAFERGYKIKPQKGDILMTRITAGVIGATALIQNNNPLAYYVSLALIRLKNQNIFVDFLNQRINCSLFKRELHKRIIHIAFPKKINLGEIGCCKISFPTVLEQKRISTFLTVIDQRKRLLKDRECKLVTYKIGLMQKIFRQEIRFKDELGQDFPDWEEKKLGELYSFKSTNSYSRDKLNYEVGAIKNIHYGDIHTKFKTHFDILTESVPFLNQDINISRINDENFVREGDLLVADASEDYADIGKAIEVVNLNNEKVLGGLHTFLLRRKGDSIAIGFGGHLMKEFRLRLNIKKIAQGTKVLSISTKRLAEISVQIPSLQEQQKIASFLSNIDEAIEKVGFLMKKTEEFKRGLLQKMFV